jgi:hypothetical protein
MMVEDLNAGFLHANFDVPSAVMGGAGSWIVADCVLLV